MANYSNLKAAINAVIKQNGQGEITGEVMNQVLIAMVNSLGSNYLFAGVATPSTNPGTPDQNVFYMATQAGTYTNFSAIVLQAGISILLWDGSWSSETFFTIDAVPTSGSNNFITSGAVFDKFKLDGGAYDVSAHNNNVTFADLNALLNSENLNTLIPVAVRHGGMSIKYVQTSDNKYVQYRLMSDSFNTTLVNWQGVDDEPTAGSNNLVKSGGVASCVLKSQPNGIIKADLIKRRTNIDFNANIGDSVIITYNGTSTSGIRFIATDDSQESEYQGTQNAVFRIFTKQVKSILIIYGDITDVDIQLIKASNNKLLLSGTYYNGGLIRSERHDCNINANSTVYVHLEGLAGTALRFISADETHSIDVTIPQGETSIDTSIKCGFPVAKIFAVYGDLTKCVLSSKEKDWSEDVQNIKNDLDNLNNRYSANLPSDESKILNLSSEDFEQGSINITGEEIEADYIIRTKNHQSIIENTKVTVSVGIGYFVRLYFYDSNFNYILRSESIEGTTGTIDVPVKAALLRFIIVPTSGALTPSQFEQTNTVVTLLNFPKVVPAIPLYLSELGDRTKYVGSLLRAVSISFFAKAGDKLHIKFKGTAGTGISLKNGSRLISQLTIPAGTNVYDDTIFLMDNVDNINAAYGDLTDVELYSESNAEFYSLPINAPAYQKPANSDAGSDFNAETITIEQLYEAFDNIIAKSPSPGNIFPKYMTKHNIEGDVTPCPKPIGEQSEAEIASSALKIRTYVLTKRNRYAWIAKYPRYAWKNPNSGSVAYTDSCCPRVGDSMYTTGSGSDVGWHVTSYSPSTGISIGRATFERYSASDYKADVVFTKDITTENLDVFDDSDQKLGTSSYVDSTHRTYNSKTYTRIESLDYHTDNKATIFIWANEHGPQSDPYEGSIISYRLAKDLCYAVDNPMLNYFKNYCKIVLIPCANPYSMNMWSAEGRPGRNNANGVNINRNYDTPGWDVSTETDKGTAAGSENETQYIMNMVKFFNTDIAIDVHVLGYTNSASEGNCHYAGHTPAQKYINKIADTMDVYGLKLSSYGAGDPNTQPEGKAWLYYNNIIGGLIEMNSGKPAASYDGNQHTDWIMQADYTLLLNTLWLWYIKYNPQFNLLNFGVL